MVRNLLLILFWTGMLTPALAQRDVIERDYFPGARAKNASIAAARYAQEGYFYTRYTTYVSAVDSSRMFADTALFFVKRSLMLGDTAIQYADPANYPAVDFLNSGIKKTRAADGVIRDYYPMSEIKSHHAFGRDAALNLSNAVMDFYNASLLLDAEKEAPDSEEERYAVLPYMAEVTRLEADETAFQQASNAFESEIAGLEKLQAGIAAKLSRTQDPALRASLMKKQHLVSQQIAQNTERLEDLSGQLGEIRQILRKKHLDDVKEVAEPDHLPHFETASKKKEVEMDKEVPDGLVYKIQLGYYPRNVDVENFHGLFPISGETVTDKLARFYAGMFYSYKDAVVGNDYVKSHAIANAFVVPFYNGEKISISTAVDMERSRGMR